MLLPVSRALLADGAGSLQGLAGGRGDRGSSPPPQPLGPQPRAREGPSAACATGLARPCRRLGLLSLPHAHTTGRGAGRSDRPERASRAGGRGSGPRRLRAPPAARPGPRTPAARGPAPAPAGSQGSAACAFGPRLDPACTVTAGGQEGVPPGGQQARQGGGAGLGARRTQWSRNECFYPFYQLAGGNTRALLLGRDFPAVC